MRSKTARPTGSSALARRRHDDDVTQWTPSCNVFINHLPKWYAKADLLELVAPYGGTVVSAKVMIDLVSGESRCYGFVRFNNILSAMAVMHGLNGSECEGKRLMARFAQSQENTGPPTDTITVRGVPGFFTKAEVWEAFAPYGEILAMDVLVDPRASPFGGTAHIRYAEVCQAIDALRDMNNVALAPDCRPTFIQFTCMRLDGPTRGVIRHGIVVEKPRRGAAGTLLVAAGQKGMNSAPGELSDCRPSRTG